MKKLFKKSILTITSLASIAGSAATAVACTFEDAPAETDDSQPKYDAAITSLKNKLTTLPNFQIMHGGASDNTKMDEFKASIEKAISALISGDNELKSILSGVTVVIPARAITTDNVTHNTALTSGNLTLTVTSSAKEVKPAAPFNFTVKYNVINNDEDNYNEAVKTIIETLNNLTETQNAFLDGTDLAKVKEALVDKINHAIGDSNQYISKFAAATLDTVLTTPATNIAAKIAAKDRRDNQEMISNIIFQSKQSVVGTAQSFTLRYKVIETKQELYDHQLTSLLAKFTTAGTGRIITTVKNGWTKAEVEAELTKLIAKEISDGGASYSVLDGADITYGGITNTTFANVTPGDHSAAAKDLTTGVTITVGSTDDTGAIRPTANSSFQFYYTVNPSTADGTTYTTALSNIATYFGAKTGTTPTHPIALVVNNAAGDGWKTSVISSMRAAILTYISTNYATVFDTGTAGANIDIEIAGLTFVDKVVSVAKLSANSITFTIPSKWTGTGTAGIPTAKKIPIVIGYTVTADQSLVDSAAGKIQTWFSTAANVMSIDRLGYFGTGDAQTKTIDEIIADSINTWKNGATSTLSDNEKASIKDLVKTDVTHFTAVKDAALTTSSVHVTDINLVIQKSDAAGSTVTNHTFTNNFQLYYEVKANARDKAAQAILDTAVKAVITDSGKATTPVVLSVYRDATSSDVETAIQNLISKKLIATPGASDWLQTAAANVTVTGVVTKGTGVNINTSAVTTGTVPADIKVSVAIATSKATATAVTAVALTGLHFEVVLSKQQLWEKQAGDIITALQTAQTTTPLDLTTSDDADSIKDKIVSAVNTQISSAAAADKTLLATTIAATDVNLVIGNFDISAISAANKTSTASPDPVKITIPSTAASTDVTTKGLDITITYTVHTTTQADYDDAMDTILNHFSLDASNLFTATTTEMGDGSTSLVTGVQDQIRDQIRKNIYDYWSLASTAAGALTAAQKTALTPSIDGGNIDIEIIGNLSITAGTNQPTTTNNDIKITIRGADGSTAAGKLFTGAKYTVTTPPVATQNDYVAAQTAILEYFKTNNLFTFSIPQMDLTPPSIMELFRIGVRKNIYNYITTYTGTGALTSVQKAAFGNLGIEGLDIEVNVKGTLSKIEGEHRTDSTNSVIIKVPANATLTAADKDLNGAKYTVIAAPNAAEEKAYNDAFKEFNDTVVAAYTETYIKTWLFGSKTHGTPLGLDGIGQTEISQKYFNDTINFNNAWINWVRNDAAFLRDPSVHVKRDALLSAFDRNVAANIFSGKIFVYLDQAKIDLAGSTFKIFIVPIARVNSILPKYFVQGVNISHA